MPASIAALAAASMLAWPIPTDAASAAADATAPNLACAPQSTAGDRQEVRCDLVATGSAQALRFTARFSGSHDDTKVSIAPTLNGAPLACAEGSTTSLTGEDGDVALTCRFFLQQPAGSQHVLRVRIVWHHAQYTDMSLHAD